MHDFFAGMATAGSLAVGLMFLRLWRESHDRLFAMFGAAFWVLSLNWLALATVRPDEESRYFFYIIRLVAFALIMLAIVDKNRPRGNRHE